MLEPATTIRVDPLDERLQRQRRNHYRRPAPADQGVCSEDCVRMGGVEPCRCYGTDEETTKGGW